MTESWYAHTRKDSLSPSDWQLLDDHLYNVASLAGEFADIFGYRDWGFLAGLWHDLGKYQPAFQEKLRGAQIGVEHSGWGAAQAFRMSREQGLPLAFVIAGHHAGLANLRGKAPGQPTPLLERMSSNQKDVERYQHILPETLVRHPFPPLPKFLSPAGNMTARDRKIKARQCEFWIRILFSAVVDADRLDTERFMDPQAGHYRTRYTSIQGLRERLDAFLENKTAGLASDARRTPVNRARAAVLTACRKAAKMGTGAFSLTVPTGGGKTLSAMAFALEHAERHGLRRVIIVIPYTSIIEQNAKEYQRALGAENVLEHHSNLDLEGYRQLHGEEETRRMQLASENWDAPVIVTTTVQFFESLFSNRPSRCRKLHNIARSVIILDEVQTLPPEYLMCILDSLNELTRHYGCSVVLSTATPPALKERQRFEWGLKEVHEIIPEVDVLGDELKRVAYVWPDLDSPPASWESLSKEMASYPQVLVIVHRRDDARELAEELMRGVPGKSVFHLSALMCPVHRLDVLMQVKERLADGEPCRLVSTQLVEAGVDVDFPVVYRALGGLDSMVQAAGRCNREGRQDIGRVVVFRAPTKPPKGTPRKAAEIVEGLLRKKGGALDVTTIEIFAEYFRSLYFGSELDAKRIQALRQEFRFADVDREFRLIEDDFSQSVIVPYKQARIRLNALQTKGPSRETLRSLQPYTVNVYTNAFQRLRSGGAVEEVAEGLFALHPAFSHLYTDDYGLSAGGEIEADPAGLIV